MRGRAGEETEPEGGSGGRTAKRGGLIAVLGLLLASPAQSECLPDPPSAGTTVTCTGNNPAGFAVPEGVESVTVVIEEGATVASIGDGIVVRENTSVINQSIIHI